MNNKKLLMIFLLVFFFIGMGSVSAIEGDSITNDSGIPGECEAVSIDIDNGNYILAKSNRITVNEGESIQSAIDNADPGSTIIVESGDYPEDLVVCKELSIIGHDANLNSEKIAFNILSDANNTSISGFNIFVSDVNGTGILINASNCNINDNRISGGNIGILANMSAPDPSTMEIHLLENITVLRNTISNVGEAGISIRALNPLVSQNNVTNVINRKENGTALGIQAYGVSLSDNLKVIVTGNRVSNIKSLNASAYGLDLAGNTVFDNLTGIDVFDNIVENVVAQVASVGMKVDIFALMCTLPTIDVHDLNISRISTTDYENSSATALVVSATTIFQNETSDVVVRNVNIYDLNGLGANSKLTGIDVTGVGCVDLHVFDNNVTDIKSRGSIEGIACDAIEYMNFKALVNVSNNVVANFNSPKIKGINAFALGNTEISKNFMHDLPGEGSAFITGAAIAIDMENFNVTIPENATIEEIIEILDKLLNNTNFTFNGNISIRGNNLEGSGRENAFLGIMPSVIHYNRAVNFGYNVIKERPRTYLLELYGYDPNLSDEELAYQYFKSNKDFENCTEEELRNMSIEAGARSSAFYARLDKLTAGDVDARFNWWGTNSRPSDSKFKNNNGTVIYDPWLMLRVNPNPQTIRYGEYSRIAADVYRDSAGADHSSDAEMFFSGPRVTLFTDKGSFDGKKSITLNWVNGEAVAYLYGDEYGLATVGASDYDAAYTTVLIVGENSADDMVGADSEVKAAMHPTGNPVLLLLFAVALLSSIGIYKRK